MPLLPQGMKNWSGVAPFHISLEKPIHTWSPLGLETIKSCRVGTALSLETDGVINSSSLMSSRSVLLCEYNFLCLPLSAKQGIIKEEETDRKLKLYNYKKLCSLARKRVLSLNDNLYLEMLSHSERRSWTL